MRWLQEQHDLPDHGGIAEEPAFELARYFNVRDEEELRRERLSEEAAVLLGAFGGGEEDDEAGSGGCSAGEGLVDRVGDTRGRGEGGGWGRMRRRRASFGNGGMGGIATGDEEFVLGACSPVMISPAGSAKGDEEALRDT